MSRDSLYVEAVCDADMRSTATTDFLKKWYADQTIGDAMESYELRETIRLREEFVIRCELLAVTGWY